MKKHPLTLIEMKNRFSFFDIIKMVVGILFLGIGLLGLFVLVVDGVFSKSDYYMDIGCLSFGTGLFFAALNSKYHHDNLRNYGYLYLTLAVFGFLAFFLSDHYIDIIPGILGKFCYFIIIAIDLFGIFKVVTSFRR